MNKLLCIVGPTGTGKTAKAIELAQKQPSILISADSRQVYRGMDIVTGKDHPAGFPIFGLDIVDPGDPCSVAVWYEAVMPAIVQAWQEAKLPIVVGGTGLYVKALTHGIETMHVPINQALRNELLSLSIIKLQQKLVQLDKAKFESLNHSDSLNPRRLTRAIEVAQHRTSHPERALASRMNHMDTILIGLKYSVESIQRNKIQERVISRLKQGAIQETQALLLKYSPSLQSISAIGYRSIIRYLAKSCTKQETINTWVADELAYVKRQMTWFRKQPVIWYDIDTYGNTQN